jgi:uncharacterized protein YbbK (DUF523 family)
MTNKFMFSSCLAGKNVRYNGGNSKVEHQGLQKLIDSGLAVLACPEVFAKLKIPRVPSEIIGMGGGAGVLDGTAKVVDKDGKDITNEFVEGAYACLDLFKKNNCCAAILKQNSPSCGSGIIYDGTFSGVKIEGYGVLGELLARNDIKLFSENELDDAVEFISKS